MIADRIPDRVRLLLVTVWVGSLWTVGYLVAPVLFATIPDRMQAGAIAGSIFAVEAWLSIFCAAALMLLHFLRPLYPEKRENNVWLAIVVAMLLFTLVGHFGLQPMMAALKAAAPNGVMEGAVKERFGVLHGISSSIYLFQSLLAALLMFRASFKA